MGRRRLAIRLLHTTVASSLLVLPILLLYLLPSRQGIVTIIVLFTLAFAFAVAVFTRAKRHEIFVATAT